VRIRLDSVRAVEASSESIDNLVLDEHAQQILRAMASRQNGSASLWSADFIEGKGAAKVILLHGQCAIESDQSCDTTDSHLQGRRVWARRILLVSHMYTDVGLRCHD